jgi:hypothetical protein
LRQSPLVRLDVATASPSSLVAFLFSPLSLLAAAAIFVFSLISDLTSTLSLVSCWLSGGFSSSERTSSSHSRSDVRLE